MAKVLVITGGSRGIGAETINYFLQAGFRIVNIARNDNLLPQVTNINIDLANSESIQANAEALKAAVHTADSICLVHNAASFTADRVGAISAAELHTVLDVNITAPMLLNNILIEAMRPGSSIIYMGSTLSEMAVANRASYVIAKHAVVGMMRATCQDLADKGIHSCCICPGFVNTEMSLQAGERKAFDALIAAKVIGKRWIEPNEIAEFIHFAAHSAIVNGSVLHANLGHRMS